MGSSNETRAEPRRYNKNRHFEAKIQNPDEVGQTDDKEAKTWEGLENH